MGALRAMTLEELVVVPDVGESAFGDDNVAAAFSRAESTNKRVLLDSSARRAGEHAYGDMRLRAGKQTSELFVEVGRRDEAMILLRETLEQA